ncbi:MAG: response regulator, partial [Chitinophagaceae bacterium]
MNRHTVCHIVFMQYSTYILCVDVVEEDCELLTESLHGFDPQIQLVFVSSGDKAVDYVSHQDGRTPSMLILDINMPGMDGKKTFLELKKVLGEDAYPAVFLT